MADYTLYYVPLTSITTQSNTFPNLDTTTSSRIGNTLQLSGPTDVIQVRDTSNDGVLNDDWNFSNQTLIEDGAGFPAGSGIELNYYYDVTGSDGSTFTVFAVAIGNSAVADTITGVLSQKPLRPGVTYTITGYSSLYNAPYNSLLCFAGDTGILCADGSERPAQDITAGDLIKTRDDGAQAVRWVGTCTLSTAQLLINAKLRPICIAPGALGNGTPTRQLRVSPQHRIVVRSRIAERMFGKDEVLVAAKHLLDVPGISRDNSLEPVTYVHLLFERHEILWSDGAETESLHTGPEAMNALDADSLREIQTLFPDLGMTGEQADCGALPFVKGQRGKTLAMRHVKNGKNLVAG